ncbi:hypothetical protein G8767_31725 [Rhodococcus sp. IC4_135]|uniref:hypothetical protein n=1 Tax=Rhodococcus sp. IC4_135 TaxID=2715537 RepID=UPI0014244916|nr:hypothetical protein [Rhodococcus sp. IC4_135]
MTTSSENIVRLKTEDGRTVSTASGSPLHLEHLAREDAETAEETVSVETDPGTGLDSAVPVTPPAVPDPSSSAVKSSKVARSSGAKADADADATS